MTAAHRLKGLGWFGGCMAVTLGFYLVSLQVAAERKRLEQVDAKIAAAERDIRALETEFDTRANLAQLERWNGDTLSLAAPGAQQFVRSETQLASIRFDGTMPAGVQTASLVVPSYTAQAVTAPVAPAVAAPAASAPAVTVKVSAPVATARIIPAVATEVRPALRKTAAVAMLDRGLLSDSTLGDLVSGARSEARRLR